MSQPNPKQQSVPEWLRLVAKQIASVCFGTVQLIVHDPKVVQFETTEKARLDKPPVKPPR